MQKQFKQADEILG